MVQCQQVLSALENSNCKQYAALTFFWFYAQIAAETSVDSVAEGVADMKVSEPAAAPSKPAPDVSTSIAAKHEEEVEEETAEDRAKREAELSKIYADLAKEDDRCFCDTVWKRISHADQQSLLSLASCSLFSVLIRK